MNKMPDFDEWKEQAWADMRAQQQQSEQPALSLVPATETPEIVYPELTSADTDRNAAMKRIKAGLETRSGKKWSVTGGRGTAWGWIQIDAPPSRRKFEYDGVTPRDGEFGMMSIEDRTELAKLLGFDRPIHPQGHNIPAASDYRREYIDRAEGRPPREYGQQYWD